jgi:hypothetical protein
MNQQQRAVIEQALEWIEAQPEPRMLGAAKIITGLRQLLEQPEPVQDPQAFLHWYDNAHWGNEDFKEGCHRSWNAAIKYATPPAQPAPVQEPVTWGVHDQIALNKAIQGASPAQPAAWVGLDEDEVEDCARGCANHAELARAIEAKLREKNGGA